MASCRVCGHLEERHCLDDPVGPCEACDCNGYAPISDEPEPPYVPTPREIAEKDIYEPLKKWAHSYDAYGRMAAHSELADLLRPIQKEARKSGGIPDWVGVDLLRAWAYRVARAHNWSCMNDSSYSCCPIMYDLAVAVQQHRAVKKIDFPPFIPPIVLQSRQGN